jgi:hypothetical protein
LTHTVWGLAGIEPKGDWVLKDDTISKFDIVQFCPQAQDSFQHKLARCTPMRWRFWSRVIP